jgi:hypothetical protein
MAVPSAHRASRPGNAGATPRRDGAIGTAQADFTDSRNIPDLHSDHLPWCRPERPAATPRHTEEPTPMATPAQVEANRRNALRSIGPRTEAGKAVSRSNASSTGWPAEGWRHGRRGRRGGWSGAGSIGPRTREAAFALDRMVAASIGSSGARRRSTASSPPTPSARLSWDADREAECAEAFARIGKAPMAVVAKLKRSLHGVDLLCRPGTAGGDRRRRRRSGPRPRRRWRSTCWGVPAACRDGGRRSTGRRRPGRLPREVALARSGGWRRPWGGRGTRPPRRKLAMAGLATLTSPKARCPPLRARGVGRYREARRRWRR